ncbi:helix-turn-helix domain-containing protein [Aliarcobacter butzleri]|uniref:helix-turn-helix domain-containing protein n=1 Tax=Aliarcobacter butzleri TaxID=28197 RepID=UPI0022498179|nr:helix-turn-helix domain-containing protein [Aliarcobacter butzleri]
MFEYLLNKKNQLVYNDELLSVIFENDYYGNIKNIIYRLRKKVSKDVIVNYKNLGYMLNTK